MDNNGFKFDNTYAQLPSEFYRKTAPEVVSAPELIAFNQPLAEDLGIDLKTLNGQELVNIFSGNQLPTGSCAIALPYAGHQFGHFVPQLGDGRAILLGELMGRSGARFDLQLKGSGRTPFSRGGDGRSAIGPVIREYILSEAMFHLGVPTTRALAAVDTGDFVQRDKIVPGGIFTRVATSHIRVGSFEYIAASGNLKLLTKLLKYTVRRHYPEINLKPATSDAELQALSLDFLKSVIQGQACLVAHWMSLGFIHGVMNTDNTSVAGITIDYGPCAFLDHYQSSKVFSSIDRHGRYSYENQPSIALWNMQRLAVALMPLISEDQGIATKLLSSVLDNFETLYETEWLRRMGQKLGIAGPQPKDRILIISWLQYLEQNNLDFTLSYRKLSEELGDSSFEGIGKKLPDSSANFLLTAGQALQKFLIQWKARLQEQGIANDTVIDKMNQVNPLYIPRNHQVEKSIQAAEKKNYETFLELNQVLENPYSSQTEFSHLADPPQPEEVVSATFCGT